MEEVRNAVKHLAMVRTVPPNSEIIIKPRVFVVSTLRNCPSDLLFI